jgi:rhodanese-related sulfurtransferase
MPVKNIDSATLKQWLSKEEAVIIDVREPSEYAAGAIPGAVLLPLRQVSAQALSNAGNKKIVMQCRSGVRSFTAGEIVLAQNPALDVYNLAGGILEWSASGGIVK